jgi:chitodextrinase
VGLAWTQNPGDGLPVTLYTISYGTAIDATGSTTTTADDNKTITGLSPGVKYYFKVKAANSVGEGPYSSISNTTTVAGAYVRSSGVWKKAIPYVKVAGVWKLARPYGKILGLWKKSIN